MFKKHSFVVAQVFIVISYFFELLLDGRGENANPITGFKSLILNQYYIIGNVLMAIILLTAVAMILWFVYELLHHKTTDKQDQIMTMLANIQLFSGMIFATFLGTFLVFGGFVLIALIVISAYTNFVLNK